MIRNVLGWILLFEAAFLALPALTALCYSEYKALRALLITMVICASVGFIMTVFKPTDKTLYSKEGLVIVSLSWIILSAFGALPFVISGAIPSYIDAFFETSSGFSTTGASILNNVEALPRSILLWRSFTNWVGGMGVLVFIMAFLPLSGANNMHIMKAESPGPSVSKLVPRVRTTALILYTIYFLFTVMQFIILLICGMPVFDAVCTSFSTAGTGGFGIKNDSFGSYDQRIQIVVTVFMLLFSVNFASYYLIIKKRFKEAFTTEFKLFVILVISAIAIITFDTYKAGMEISKTLTDVSFTVASIISTTGFSTADFNLWSQLSKSIIILLMFTGACAGSTCGGIKLSRIILFFKNVTREFRYMIHPKQVKRITIDGRSVDEEVARSVSVYLVCYVIVFVATMILISPDTDTFGTSFSAVAATINNIGPGIDAVGPTSNFAFFSPFSKIVLSFNMLAGRLELFPMLLLFNPSTWKKN